MPPRSYSERIAYTEVPLVWAGVEIPDGYRAVIKTIIAVNNTAAQAQVLVSAHGILVMSDGIPAASSLSRSGLHIVLYERETVRMYQYASNGAVSVHGYLFVDEDERVEFPPIEGAGALPAPPPWLGPAG